MWQAWSPDGERYPLPAMAIANDNARKLLASLIVSVLPSAALSVSRPS